ncbi:MAG: hypothetical protein H0X67_11105 [Acidobacteria bacterium]|nr:hypothetical protein [Acidobacteriota bacterium]
MGTYTEGSPPEHASLFLKLLDSSDPDVRLAPRLVRVDPARPQALGLHRDVEAHLVPHLGLQLRRAPERPPH